MPVEYCFGEKECPSFGGASLSLPRENLIIKIEKYLNGKGNQSVKSTDIENAIDHNPGDTRSLLAILKKFGFTNLDNTSINADDFFTKDGLVFIHCLKAKKISSLENSNVYEKVLRAYHLLLQESIWSFYTSGDKSSLGMSIIFNILGKTKTLSVNEYCYALSEYISNQENCSWDSIADDIILNRNNNVEYNFTKKTRTKNKLDSVEKKVPDSVLQSTREILQQAGILATNSDALCSLLDDTFFIKHNL